MSLVNYETGEIVAPMTVDEARRITERIRLTAGSARESLDRLQRLMTEAQQRQAHVALGYASWTAYVADLFSEEPLRLPRDQRQELVGYLAGEGMSARSIAPIVGVSKSQVAADIQVSSPGHVPTPQGEATDVPEAADRGDIAPDVPRPAVKPITGMDGKTYTRPEPKAKPATPPRRALTDQFFDAAYDLTKAVERVARLADDDRWPQNAEKVAAKHRNDLLQAIDGLRSVVNRLPSA